MQSTNKTAATAIAANAVMTEQPSHYDVLPYGSHVYFPEANEIVIIETNDRNALVKLIFQAIAYLRDFRTEDARALALASFCLQTLRLETWNKFRSWSYQEFVKDKKREQSLLSASLSNGITKEVSLVESPVKIYLYDLLNSEIGQYRHAKLLYKYLADAIARVANNDGTLEVKNTGLVTNNVLSTTFITSCRLSRRDNECMDLYVTVRRNGLTNYGSYHECLLDMQSNRLVEKNHLNYEALLISSYFNLHTVEKNSKLTAKFENRSVDIRCSTRGLLSAASQPAYDDKLFEKEMKAFEQAKVPSIIKAWRCVPMGYNEAQPALVMITESLTNDEIRIPILTELRRVSWDRDDSKLYSYKLKAALRLAETLHKLHSLDVIYDELTPSKLVQYENDPTTIMIGNFSPERYRINSLVSAAAKDSKNSIDSKEDPLMYRAPELWKNDKLKPSKETDVYSFGRVIQAITFAGEMNTPLTDLLKQCTDADPRKRPTMEVVFDIVSNLLHISDMPRYNCYFSAAAEASGTKTCSFSLDNVLHMRKKLNAMGDNATIATREKFLDSLGKRHPNIFISKDIEAPAFYVVLRPSGYVALVSCGLWNSQDPSAPGVEVIAEVSARDIDLIDIESSWLYQCFLELVVVMKKNASTLLLTSQHQATIDVKNAQLPEKFFDPGVNRGHMLLEGGSSAEFKSVTARVLSLSQWRKLPKSVTSQTTSSPAAVANTISVVSAPATQAFFASSNATTSGKSVVAMNSTTFSATGEDTSRNTPH